MSSLAEELDVRVDDQSVDNLVLRSEPNFRPPLNPFNAQNQKPVSLELLARQSPPEIAQVLAEWLQEFFAQSNGPQSDTLA